MLTDDQVLMAAQMIELRRTMKTLLGDSWDTKTKLYRQILTGAMKETGDQNPLAAVIPIAKDMSAKGHNPTLLMAVAVDMSDLKNYE